MSHGILFPPLWHSTPGSQIANVGFVDVNNHAVRKAVATNTLFIHGSRTGGGGTMFHVGEARVMSPALLLGESNGPVERCKPLCGAPSATVGTATASVNAGMTPAAASRTSTVCDRSCYADGERKARFGGYLCGAGDVSKFGAFCRTCYNTLEEARAAEDLLAKEEQIALDRRHGNGGDNVDDADDEDMMAERRRHVIMCDTLMPPPAAPGCSLKCQRKDDTVRFHGKPP